jgi:hypothetical protein
MKISAEEEYSKALLDKRVLLVAPSEVAFQTEDEELRSRFDVIARIGHGYRHNLRTDILFHALKGNQGNGVREVDVDEAYNVGVKYLLYPRFIRGRIRKLKARNSKFKTMGIGAGKFAFGRSHLERQMKFKARGRRWKNSPQFKRGNALLGIVAIWELLQHNPKELHVFGMDFYRTGHFAGYDKQGKASLARLKRRTHRFHHLKSNAAWLLQAMKEDKRLTVDSSTFCALKSLFSRLVEKNRKHLQVV